MKKDTKDFKPNKLIYRSDTIILLSFYEKEWKIEGRLPLIARHKQFREDPRVTYITLGMPWWFIKKYLYSVIGAPSPEEMQKSIDEVYGKPVSDNVLMFLHEGNFV